MVLLASLSWSRGTGSGETDSSKKDLGGRNGLHWDWLAGMDEGQGQCLMCSLGNSGLWWGGGHWLELGCKRQSNLEVKVSLGHDESKGTVG